MLFPSSVSGFDVGADVQIYTSNTWRKSGSVEYQLFLFLTMRPAVAFFIFYFFSTKQGLLLLLGFIKTDRQINLDGKPSS